MRVAVIGATGAVGRTILRILEERSFPCDELVPFASARSDGKLLQFRGEPVRVRRLQDHWFDGIDVAFATAGGAVSRDTGRPTLCADPSPAGL